MSQMPPFLRGYRQALRDVQRAVLLYGRTISGPVSASSAVLVAADRISAPLRQLRQSGIGSVSLEVRKQTLTVSTKQTDFVRGYLAGFDQAVSIVADWGGEMNNPAARDAIRDAVARLQQARSQLTNEEGAKTKTLQARKFVVSG